MKKSFFILALFMCFISNAQLLKILEFDTATTGGGPSVSLVHSDKLLYGVTYSSKGSIIFKINNDGTEFSKLYTYDSANIHGTLKISGNSLYGMTNYAGKNRLYGNVFKIYTNGTGYKELVVFNNINGAVPVGSLIISGKTIFGMTQGGINNKGTIFKVDTNGTGFLKILDFDSIKGSIPYGSLTFSDNILYGATASGGDYDDGVLFKINADGSGYTKLVDFDRNKNGARPLGSLILTGNVLYGMTREGGTKDSGIIFKVNTDGNAFNTLFSFSKVDGRSPVGGLVLSGDTLYGMTTCGGSYDIGVLFGIKTDGSNYNTIIRFGGSTCGFYPLNAPTLCDNVLYGMTSTGGIYYNGVLFKYFLPVSTKPNIVNNNIILDNAVVFPNPFEYSFSVQYELSQESEVTIDISNALGLTEFCYSQTKQSGGVYALQFNALQCNLSKGIHFIRISANGKVSAIKCVSL